VLEEDVMTAGTFCTVLGTVLLLVGIVGTFTGSHDHMIVVFGVNATHNAVHILTGALALVAGFTERPIFAQVFCLVFAALYGLVTVAGFAGVDPVVRALNLNMADNFLHLAITAAAAWFGIRAAAARGVQHPGEPLAHHR
jgi:hypothetical protein